MERHMDMAFGQTYEECFEIFALEGVNVTEIITIFDTIGGFGLNITNATNMLNETEIFGQNSTIFFNMTEMLSNSSTMSNFTEMFGQNLTDVMNMTGLYECITYNMTNMTDFIDKPETGDIIPDIPGPIGPIPDEYFPYMNFTSFNQTEYFPYMNFTSFNQTNMTFGNNTEMFRYIDCVDYITELSEFDHLLRNDSISMRVASAGLDLALARPGNCTQFELDELKYISSSIAIERMSMDYLKMDLIQTFEEMTGYGYSVDIYYPYAELVFMCSM